MNTIRPPVVATDILVGLLLSFLLTSLTWAEGTDRIRPSAQAMRAAAVGDLTTAINMIKRQEAECQTTGMEPQACYDLHLALAKFTQELGALEASERHWHQLLSLAKSPKNKDPILLIAAGMGLSSNLVAQKRFQEARKQFQLVLQDLPNSGHKSADIDLLLGSLRYLNYYFSSVADTFTDLVAQTMSNPASIAQKIMSDSGIGAQFPQIQQAGLEKSIVALATMFPDVLPILTTISWYLNTQPGRQQEALAVINTITEQEKRRGPLDITHIENKRWIYGTALEVIGTRYNELPQRADHTNKIHIEKTNQKADLQRIARAELAKAMSEGGPINARDIQARVRQAMSRELIIGMAANDLADKEPDQLFDQGFSAAQIAGISTTAFATSQMTARLSASDPPLAQQLRQHQQLIEQQRLLQTSIIGALNDNDQSEFKRLQEKGSTLLSEIELSASQINQVFPAYMDLISPMPLTREEVQVGLKEREALLLIVPWQSQTYIFAVSQAAHKWATVKLGEVELSEHVARLRCELDLLTCRTEVKSNMSKLTGAKDKIETAAQRAVKTPYSLAGQRNDPNFDYKLAHDLYRALIAPVSDVLDTVDHVYVVAAGALSSIPFSILITEIATQANQALSSSPIKDSAWLADRYQLTTLPAVSSLRSNRPRAIVKSAQAFLGFGDPHLEDRIIAGKRFYPLPGTRDEILSMASALRAPMSAVKLGAEARENILKQADLHREVMAIASHGLLALESGDLNEPGLVFTPPETISEQEDGILTSSEISQLNLSVEWLILSACNTAAGGNEEAGLSGLARAFIYAGARSLLVSHWRVRDDVTARLTVATLENARRMSRPAALQAAMKAIRTGKDLAGNPVHGWQPDWAYPSAWAPFILVGAGI